MELQQNAWICWSSVGVTEPVRFCLTLCHIECSLMLRYVPAIDSCRDTPNADLVSADMHAAHTPFMSNTLTCGSWQNNGHMGTRLPTATQGVQLMLRLSW